MNKIEKIVYDLVKKTPWLKLLIRNIYQGIFDLLPRKKEFSVNPISIKENFFYGFHDTLPFSESNDKLLANKLYFDLRMPLKGESLDVGFFLLDNGKFGDYVKVGESLSWNYHKGCRLQWLTVDKLIYNTVSKEGTLLSIIYDINTLESKEVCMPIDSASHDGRFATSFSYERLEKYMPGYGYCYEDDYSYIDNQYPEKSGLFLVDLKTNTSSLLVSLKKLYELVKEEVGASVSNHYVTHSLFSNDNKYIAFFHRWVGDDTRKRYTRFMIYDLAKKELFSLPTGYMVSHYVWNENNEIIVYCNYEGVDCHVLFKIEDLINSHKVAYPRLNSDGHQSFLGNSKFVTDTYGDKFRMSKLYLVDVNTSEVELLASVYSPNKFQTKIPTKHIACDLHPTVSKDGKYVCFDTVKSGKRAIALMRLN